MTTPTFVPPFEPSPQSTVDVTPRVLEASFGDGYSQRTQDGLNAQQDEATWVWALCTPAEFEEMRSFFSERGGHKPFFYTQPDDAAPKKFICSQWTKAFDSGMTRAMTAKFKQVFDPGD